MGFELFGSVQVFRPSPKTENAIRQKARSHLLSSFAPGEYRGRAAANKVVHHQFGFFERSLRTLIPLLASRDAAEFLLYQFDQASCLLHGNDIHDLRERSHWLGVEPRFKRAIKYLVELICMQPSLDGDLIRSRDQAVLVMEEALIGAECLVDLAMNSDLLHSLFPDDCVVTVFDSGPVDWKIGIEGKFAGFDRIFMERVVRDRESRHRFVGSPQFDNHTATHQRHLDGAFCQSFGMSYGEFIAAIQAVIDNCSPAEHANAFSTIFVHRGRVIDELAKSGRSRSAIERAIDGFSIVSARLITEGRVVWNPKQENRAYRRGFFVLPHETGPHLAFSRAMARENLIQLVTGVSYKRLPIEWEAAAIQKGLGELSSEASEWFENAVCRNLRSLGCAGQRVHRTIGSGKQRLQIPEAVGEIDFLGFYATQNILVLAEAKMVNSGVEARYWRDDLDEFVFDSSSYAARFRRKISWVKQNAGHLSSALGLGPVSGVGAVMLTLYPCVAWAFINDFPCVSLAEFMLEYERRSGWPYPLV